MSSILERARQEGWNQREAYQGQIDEDHWDAAFEYGHRAARDQVPSRFRWFIIGAVTASIGVYLI